MTYTEALRIRDERIDELMAEATKLQDEGDWSEADTKIAEAENTEDLFSAEWDTAP